MNPHLGICTACVQALAGIPQTALSRFLTSVWGPEAAKVPIVVGSPSASPDPARSQQLLKELPQLRRAVAQNPKDVRHLLRLAETFLVLGNNSAAIAAFQTAAEQCVKQGAFLKAVATLKMIISIEPNAAGTRLEIARLYANLGYHSHARPEALTAIRLGWPTISAEALELALAQITDVEREKLRIELSR